MHGRLESWTNHYDIYNTGKGNMFISKKTGRVLSVRDILVGLFVVIGLAAFTIVTVDEKVAIETFTIKVVGVYQKPAIQPKPAILIGELDNGIRVHLKNSQYAKATIGDTVQVNKMQSKILGSISYNYIKKVKPLTLNP